MDPTETQYNTLQSTYSILYPPNPSHKSPFPHAHIEEYQLQHALTSPTSPISVSGKSILDLAGGSGYYSFRILLKWHAANVTCCDISEGMIEAGRTTARSIAAEGMYPGHDLERDLKFVVGDAASPGLARTVLQSSTDEDTQSKGFDVVTAAWLLNYAESEKMLQQIWMNVGQCLHPGGWFVGLTTPPLLTNQAFEEDLLDDAYRSGGTWGRFGTQGKVLERMRAGAGWEVETELKHSGQGKDEKGVCFKNFHIRKQVVEETIAQTGMFDEFRWADFVLSEELRKKWPEMSSFETLMPHCRVFIAKRRTART